MVLKKLNQLVAVLCSAAPRSHTLSEFVDGKLKKIASSTLLVDLLEAFNALTVEAGTKEVDVLTHDIIDVMLQKHEHILTAPERSDLLQDMSGRLLCELRETLEQHVQAERNIISEVKVLAEQLLELKETTDISAESVMLEKNKCVQHIQRHAFNRTIAHTELTLSVLTKMMDLSSKHGDLVSCRDNSECTKYLSLASEYREGFAELVMLAQVPPSDLYSHLPPLDSPTSDELQKLYTAELSGAADSGLNGVVTAVQRGLEMMPVPSVVPAMRHFMLSSFQSVGSLEGIVRLLALLYRLCNEASFEPLRDHLMCSFLDILEEIIKGISRLKTTQASPSPSYKTVLTGFFHDCIVLSLIQCYTAALIKRVPDRVDLCEAKASGLLMATDSCVSSLLLRAYLLVRCMLVSDLFAKRLDAYYETLEETEAVWATFLYMQQTSTKAADGSLLDEPALLSLSQAMELPADVHTAAIPALTSHLRPLKRYGKCVTIFRDICNAQSQTLFHRRGSYYIHKTDKTRALIDCSVLLERIASLLTCNSPIKAVLLADGVQAMAFHVLLAAVKERGRVPYTPVQTTMQDKFASYAANMHQRVTTSLLTDSSLVGPGSEYTLLTVLQEYTAYKHNLALGMKRYTTIPDAVGMTLRQEIAGTANELGLLYVLQEVIMWLVDSMQVSRALALSNTRIAEKDGTANTDGQGQPDQQQTAQEEPSDESDIFASGLGTLSMAGSTGPSMTESSIRSMRAVYDALEKVAQSLISDELSLNFNLIEVMQVSIRSAASEYRRDGKVDRAGKTGYSAKLIATLKTNFYALQFGILATPSTASVPSTDSVLSIVTPSVVKPFVCSLFNYQFYNAFTIYACHSFITAAGSVQTYTPYGRTCLMHDYCAFHGFLNSVLPEFCLSSIEIQRNFEIVRSYIDLYFGSLDDIRMAIAQQTYTNGQLLALIRTGLVHKLSHDQIDALVLSLPGSTQ